MFSAFCKICFLRSFYSKSGVWRTQGFDDYCNRTFHQKFQNLYILQFFFSKGPTQNSSKYGIGPSQQDNSTWWRDVEWVPSARRAHLVRFPGTFHIKHCPNLVHHGFITNPLFAFLTWRSALSQIFQSALFPELLEEPVEGSPWGRWRSIAESPCRGRPPDWSKWNKTIP